MLILITSATTHRDQRVAIRQTWGQYASRDDIAMAFVVGETNNQTITDAMKNESDEYGDMIYGHFEDTYAHLTLKTMAMLEFTDNYCSQAGFMFKTDDDMFINVEHILSYIEENHFEKHRKIIFGSLYTRFVKHKINSKNSKCTMCISFWK